MANKEQVGSSVASCDASGQVAPKERRIFSKDSLTGVCPACGGRFELGYRGVLTEHAPHGREEPE